MDIKVNVREAKTHLSRLLERVRLGEEVVLTKRGHPVAKIVPIRPVVKGREPGTARGDVWIGEDFDDPLPRDLPASFG